MQRAHLMLQDDHKLDLSSGIGSQNLESVKPWDSINWPQSTLWSPLCSSQGSPEGSSSPNEPSAFMNSHDSDWESSYDVVGKLEKMKLDDCGNSYQSLLHEQIRANQLARLRQEQILSLKQKLAAYGEYHGHHISQQSEKKDKEAYVGFDNGRRARLQWPGPPHQPARLETQPLSPGGSCSRGTFCGTSNGTGVFLPRGRTSAPLESSRRRPGKGCSTVLIPARVVQALQLHFDQIAATSGPKPAGFPPLHDVLVSNSDGMYSLQKRQSRKKPTHTQNEMILPREWTY